MDQLNQPMWKMHSSQLYVVTIIIIITCNICVFFFSFCFVVCSIHLINEHSIDEIQWNTVKRNIHITSVNDDKNHNKLLMTLWNYANMVTMNGFEWFSVFFYSFDNMFKVLHCLSSIIPNNLIYQTCWNCYDTNICV